MVFQRFLPYVREQLKLYIAGFIGSLFRFLIPLSVPLVMKYLLDDLLQNEALSNDGKIRQIALIAMIVLIVFFLIRGPMEYVRQFFLHKANNKIIKALRTDTFRKIHTLDAKYFAEHKSGEVGTRFFDDIEKIRGYMTAVFSNIWIEMIVLLFVVGVMAFLNVPLTLLAVGLVATQFVLAHGLSKKLKLTTSRMMKYRSVLNGFVLEKIQGAFLSKLFLTEKKDAEELERHLVQYEQLTDRQAKINAISLAAVNVLSDATPFIIVLTGSLSVIHGNLSLGALIAFFAYVDRMRSPVAALVQAFPAIAEGNVALQRIFEFLDTPVTVKERKQAVPLKGFHDSIVFRNVSFSYHPDREVIRNLSLTLRKGRTYAFVGESGGGKSTILQLLTRMYDPDRGEIRIDGIPLTDLSIAGLREQMGMVTQDNFLYSASVKHNIRLARPDASDEEVIAAAKKAYAHEFICALPDGYDTEIGERGVKLSGGQKQRIALARVFLKDPALLLLDEATSALDNESEQLVQKSITEAGRDKTVIMIAHRLSTVRNADTIFVIRSGAIVEQGSHSELMRRGGYYRELYEQQNQEKPRSLLPQANAVHGNPILHGRQIL